MLCASDNGVQASSAWWGRTEYSDHDHSGFRTHVWKKAWYVFGFVGGLMIDAMFNSVIGLTILIYSFIGYVNGMLNKLYFKERLYIPVITIVLSDLAYGVLYYVCRFMLRGRMDFMFYLIHVMIPEAVYTLIIGVPIYLLMRQIKEHFKPEEHVSLEEHVEMDREKAI